MNTVANVLFDDSLSCLAGAIYRTLGENALQDGVVLRDTTGRLSFIVARQASSEEERKRVTKVLKESLGPYARSDRVLAFQDDPGAVQLLQDPTLLPVQVD